MRWPLSWLFRAAAENDGRADARDAPGSPGAPSASPGPSAGSPARRPDRPAWRELPPIRTAIGEPPLTVPAGSFEASLASIQRPVPFLQALGHEVRADGPSGLVAGLANPLVVQAEATPAQTGGPPLVPGRPSGWRGRATAAGRDLPIPGPVPGPRPMSEATLSAPAEAETSLPEVERRPIPVVGAGEVVPALAATAVAETSAPPPVRPRAPLVGRLAPVTVAGDARVTAPSAAFVEARPAAPAATAGEAMPAAAVGPRAGSPGSPSPGALPVARRTLGESRRLGLGPPLATRPVAQRLPEGAQGADGAPGADTAGGAHGGRLLPAPLPPARAAEASLPTLALARPTPVQAAPAERPAGDVEPGQHAPGVGAAPAEPGLAPATPPLGAGLVPEGPPPIAPIIGSRPLSVTGKGAAGLAESPARAAGEGDEMTASRLPADGAGEPAAALTAEPPPALLPARPTGAAGQLAPASGTTDRAEDGAAVTRARVARVPVVARLVGERAIRPSIAPLLAVVPPAPVEEAGPAGPAVAARPLVPPGSAAYAAADRPTGSSEEAGWPPQVGATAPEPVTSGPAAAFGPAAAGPAGSQATLPAAARTSVAVARLATAVGHLPEEPDLPVVRRSADRGGSAAAPQVAGQPGMAGDGLAVQATAFEGVPAEAAPAFAGRFDRFPVQRAVTTGEVQSEVTPAAGGAAGGAAAGGSEQDLDALAGRLYGRIRDRLADELLADRERAGLIADL